MSSEDTIKYLYLLFDKKHYSITNKGIRYFIKNKENEKECLIFDFDDSGKTLYIPKLRNCKTNDNDIIGSGKHLINNFINMAKDFEYSIELEDQSAIDGISLKWLYLLSTGKTWYNSLGLKEELFDENDIIMNKFIKLPIRALLDEEIYENYNYPDGTTKKFTKLNTLLEKNNKLDTPIKKIFTELKEHNKMNELTDYEKLLIDLFLKRCVLKMIDEEINIQYLIEKYNIDISEYSEKEKIIVQDNLSIRDIFKQKTYLITMPFEWDSVSRGGGKSRKYVKKRCNKTIKNRQ